MSTESTVTPRFDTAAAASRPDLHASPGAAPARVNLPLNLANYEGLESAVVDQLVWFHQYTLDHAMSLQAAGEAIGYDASTVSRMMKGTYEGNWTNISDAIASYRRLLEVREGAIKHTFAENRIWRMVSGALDFALANQSIALITGESRMGKTSCALEWRDRNNHGRTVFVTAPPVGGAKAFIRAVGTAVGVGKNNNSAQVAESCYRAFNGGRMLIVDEVSRLLPGRDDGRATSLEFLRDLHDQRHCAIGLLCTARFSDSLRKGAYQYEQLLGRIDLPVRLPRRATEEDVLPILTQYIKTPGEAAIAAALDLASQSQRLGLLVSCLKIAHRLASQAKSRVGITDAHFLKAIKIRSTMMGETSFAAKEA